MFAWNRLLPRTLDAPGRLGVAFWMLVAVNLVETVRSFLHMLLPDGGAGSIAGISVEGPGGGNIVAIFGQWGASQLVMALIIAVVLVRYRALVPLMWLAVAIEQALRLLVGHLKPLTTSHTPPGAYETHILLPLAVVMLLASLRAPRD